MVCQTFLLFKDWYWYRHSTHPFVLCFGTELKRRHTLFYTPFPLLTPSTTHDQGLDALSYPQLASIENLISEKQWFAARQASSILIQQALQGLHYLQTYDRFLIRGIVSAAYMGWTSYAVLHILRYQDYRRSVGGGKPVSLSTSTTTILVTVASGLVLLAFWTLFALQHSPWSFYVYIMFPCYFWWRVLEELCTAISDGNHRRPASGTTENSNRKRYFLAIVINVFTVVLALQGMVVNTQFLDLYGKCLYSATRLVILTGSSGALVSFWLAWYGHYSGTIKLVRGQSTPDGLCHALSLRYFRCFWSIRKRVFWLCTFCLWSVTLLMIFSFRYAAWLEELQFCLPV